MGKFYALQVISESFSYVSIILQDNPGSSSKVTSTSGDVTSKRYDLWDASCGQVTLPMDVQYWTGDEGNTGLNFYNSRWYDPYKNEKTFYTRKEVNDTIYAGDLGIVIIQPSQND